MKAILEEEEVDVRARYRLRSHRCSPDRNSVANRTVLTSSFGLEPAMNTLPSEVRVATEW